jgi:hypothetical protein
MGVRVLAVLAAGVVLTSFGASAVASPLAPSAKTPDQLVADTLAAAKSARSVHVVASGIVESGQQLSFDLHLVSNRGGAGSISLGKLKFDMVRIGKFAYFKGGADLWSQFGGSALVALFKNRWVRGSATTGDLASFTPLTDISQLFTAILTSHGKLVRGGRKTIGGRSAIGIVDTSKSGGGTLWVAASGPPYPLELTQSAGHGVISFDGWNSAVRLAAPKNALDYTKLKK